MPKPNPLWLKEAHRIWKQVKEGMLNHTQGFFIQPLQLDLQGQIYPDLKI